MQTKDHRMTDKVEKTPRQLAVENGEQLVITLSICFVLLEVFGIVFNIKNGQDVNFIRTILTLVTSFYFYKGKPWAKFLLTLGSLFGVLLGVFTVFRFLLTGNPVLFTFNGIVFVGLTLFNCIAAYYLIFSGDIDEFMKSRKV
jgi:hypothetical protein